MTTELVGDTFRRAVPRSVAQQIAASVERATALFQYALSTPSAQSASDMPSKVEYTFIQNRFHPMTLSSKHDFIQ